MRVISGRLKGRNIKTLKLKDGKVRPTKTKAREALFSILYSAKDFNRKNNILEETIVLDLCCGTGSLGIESISRGAKFCYFIDQDSDVLSILSETIVDLKLEQNTRVIRADIQDLPKAREGCDLIFIDPPYKVFEMKNIILNLDRRGWIKGQAIIVVESYFQEDLQLDLERYRIITERIYGKTKLTIIQNNVL